MTLPRQSAPAEPFAALQRIREHLDAIKIGDATRAWKALGGILLPGRRGPRTGLRPRRERNVKAGTYTPSPVAKATLSLHPQLKQTKLTSREYTDDRRPLEALGFHNEGAREPAGFQARFVVIMAKSAAAEVAP